MTDALRRAEEALPDWFREYDIAPCMVREMDAGRGGELGARVLHAAGRGRLAAGRARGEHCTGRS